MVLGKGIVRRFLVFMAAIVLSGGLPFASATTDKRVVDLRTHPTSGATPVEVSIGLYLTNLASIDETRETFEVAGYLFAKWIDPRLKTTAGDKAAIRAFKLEELWTPPIEAANSISHKMNAYTLQADGNGVVNYVERFDAVLSGGYRLRQFPFDTQALRMDFQPFLTQASEFRFADRALSSTGINLDNETELAAWRLKDLKYTTETLNIKAFGTDVRQAVFQVMVARRSGFYVWKIFLPLLILTLIPVVVFWIDVKEFDWILKIPMTMLLSLVAFEFAIARDMPKIGYMTFLDAVFLASFAFFGMCIFEIAMVFLMQKAGRRPLAMAIHAAGRWAYPLAYFCVVAGLGFYFLG
jgi:Neurotransmitter-gated ion-channel ligand binding domain